MIPHKIPRRMSARARTFNWVLRATAKPAIFFFHDHPAALKTFDFAYTQACTLLKFNHTPKAIKITSQKLTHCDGEWLRARGINDRKVIYYLHGGAYFMSSPELHRSVTWRLSSFMRRSVFALDYRDAPTHDIEHCLEDAIEGYEYLLNSGYKPEDIIIAGDSAGGHLSLLTMQWLRDNNRPLPAASILISPWTDLSCQSDSLTRNNLSDPYFWGKAIRKMGGFFTKSRDASEPLLSPVNGDFKGLPPLMFLVGSIEVLRDDARRAAERAFDAGVKVCYEEWKGMPHVFPFFSNVIPEGRKAFKHMATFVQAVENETLTQYLKQHTQMHAMHPYEPIGSYA